MAMVKYKRDFKELEQRRRKGMRMLARGLAQAEVARQLDVSRQTVSNWERARQEDPQAWRRKPLGKPGGMTDKELARLSKLIVSGAIACGFPTDLWTLARVAKLIEREFARSYSAVHVWRLLRQLGFSGQRPAGRAIQRDEAAIAQWKAKRWPALKKKARCERRTIVFVDEPGLSERPTRVRTWAPKGQTPIPQYSFIGKPLSLIAGVTFWNFYFRFFHGAIKAPQWVEFLRALTCLVRAFAESLGDRVVLNRLTGYAPELNPVENLFDYAKQRELASLCLHTIDEVKAYASRRLKSMRRRPRPITGGRTKPSCWRFDVMYLRKTQ